MIIFTQQTIEIIPRVFQSVQFYLLPEDVHLLITRVDVLFQQFGVIINVKSIRCSVNITHLTGYRNWTL